MSTSDKPVLDHPLDDGFVGAGRPLASLSAPISDEDLKRLEEAWNDPRAYELWKDEGFVGAGWVPKPAVEPSEADKPRGTTVESVATPH